MTAVHVCSLINKQHQSIEPGGWQLLRFPYGKKESYDEYGMHQVKQPDGGSSAYPDERSGLIWPSMDGWGILEANIHWEAAEKDPNLPDIPGLPDWMTGKRHRYTVLKDVFVRDPLNLAHGEPGDEGEGGNITGRDQRTPAPGAQAFTKHHGLFVHPGVPLGVYVAHDAKKPVKVVHAQLKLTIWPVDHGEPRVS